MKILTYENKLTSHEDVVSFGMLNFSKGKRLNFVALKPSPRYMVAPDLCQQAN